MAKRKAHRRTAVNDPGRLSELARAIRLSLQMLAAGSFIINAPTTYAAPPPPPLPNALPSPRTDFIESGVITGGKPVIDPLTSTMTINQQSDRAILRWDSFNIGSAATVNFHQNSASSVALNRINALNGPSRIFGRLNATGQVYLLNQNGIIFGRGSQTNVGALVASSLNITQEALDNGITGAILQKKPAFTQYKDDQGNNLTSGAITVEDGAAIASKGGNIMLFAPTITNSGTITTPDGQAILAAGQGVYLAASTDPTEQGLLVEIDGNGGSVQNLGQIIAEHGSVSLLGLAVQQDGLVRATTSVRANGSIQLLARDDATVVQAQGSTGAAGLVAVSTHTGSVEFGAGSVTEVVVDNSPETTVDAATQPLSRVDVMGKTIHLQQDSRISAKGGDVNLIALVDPSIELAADGRSLKNSGYIARNDGVRIQMEQGSLIDVSGNDAQLSMERNALQVELRGTALSDAPQQRNGVLQGQTVTVDLRQGTPLANIDGATANIERTAAERLSTGGQVKVQSTGEIRFLPDAKIDVSGGQLNYQEGYLNTTKLLSAGNVVDIGQADPNRHYDAILGSYSLYDKKWGVTRTWNTLGGRGTFQAGYVEGKDAGGVNFAAAGMILAGNLQGHTVTGLYQRDAAHLPMGGELTIGLAPVGGASDLLAPNVHFHADVPSTTVDFNQPLPTALHDNLELSTRYLTQGGYTRTAVYSNGKVTVAADAPITLQPGVLRPGIKAISTSSFAVTARAIDIAADITAPGGAISLNGIDSSLAAPLPLSSSDTPNAVTIADGVTLSTRGVWTNDVADAVASLPLASVAVDGGSISLNANTLSLGHGATLDASGGGWLASNGKITGGNGGNITLKAAQNFNLGGNLALRSLALGRGGTLGITTTGLTLEGGMDTASLAEQEALWNGQQHVGAGQALRLPSFIFERGGFSNYKLTVQTNDVLDTTGFVIAQGAVIRPRMDNWILNSDFRRLASGAPMQDVAQAGRLTDDLRSPTNLSFATLASTLVPTANLEMRAEAEIDTDPGAQVSMHSVGRLQIDGTIAAPAGKISLAVDAAPDATFRPDRALWLGHTATLDARGAVVLKPSDQGLRQGQVLSGGQVTLSAQDAYVIAASGSRIDVSGTTSTLDLPSSAGTGTVRTPVAGDAGSIDIRASEGLVLDGSLLAHKASVDGAAGGSLTLGAVDRSIVTDPNLNPYPTSNSDAKLVVVQKQETRLPVGFKPTDALPSDKYNGQTVVSAQQIQEGGFDQLTLATSPYGRIDLQGAKDPSNPLVAPTLNLNVRRSIVMDTPILATSNQSAVNLQSSHIVLGANTTAKDASGGTGQLTLHAGLVDLVDNSALQGFGDTHIIADGDIRLASSNSEARGFSTVGQLTLQANQVYPTTLTRYTLEAKPVVDNLGAVTTPGSITIQSNPGGLHSQPVLSAAGKLILNATRIDQSGVLKAPLGQIEFNASERLTLNKDSLTSVSGEGQTVLFGRTENTDWVYGPLGSAQKIYTDTTQNVPEKKISLNGTDVEVKSGAVVDVAGGGDLLAYEWIPGPGGSKDALAPANTPNTYAILPALGPTYAPLDTQEYAGSMLRPGDSVYLAGGAGLAAGQYALLPARYALLPGAYLVTAVQGYQDLSPGQPRALLDGTPVLAGYRTVLGTDIRASRSAGFAVRPGSYATQLAEYKLSHGSSFFAARATALELATPRLPQDAGNFNVSAINSIDLSGELRAAAQGRGAQVDIAADRLAVVAKAGDSSGPGGPYVELVADKLNQFGAESLMLGGLRHASAAGTEVDVKSNAVLIAAGADLHAPEVTLAAKNTVDVRLNAKLSGTSAAPRNTPAETLLLHGNGALLRVSAGAQAHILRDGEISGPDAQGSLNVEAGTLLQADRSMTLDASVDTRNQGQIVMNGGSLNLGAKHITLGDTTGVIDGLTLSKAALAQIKVDELVLTSRESVDVRGAVDLNFKNLAIEAGGLLGGANAAATAAIKASDTITLSNPGNVVLAGATPAQGGDLQLSADHIVLGKGNFALQGYTNVNLAAAQDITTLGKGSLNVDSQRLILDTSRITGATGADQTINTSGRVQIAAHAATTAATAQATQGLGARLAINALGIEDAGRIELHSGSVTLHARGTQASDGVSITPGAVVDVSGVDKQFADTVLGTPGGQVTLTADRGDVVINAAKVDVSGGSAGGDGGNLNLSATGSQATVNISGADLQGSANASAQGASFMMDTTTLADSNVPGNGYTELNNTLNSGGFSGTRSLRLRRGDVAIEFGTETKAHQFTLTADQGRIDVAGKINATGESGGTVILNAATGIALARGSSVQADATGTGKRGGSVDLNTTNNGVLIADVAPGGAPLIDVSGGPADNTTGVAAGAGGRVGLRLPRSAVLTVADLDPANDQLHVGANSIKGAASTTVEAYQRYDIPASSSIAGMGDPVSQPWLSDAASFMSAINVNAILAGLGKAGDTSFHLTPGIELQSAGDLTLAQSWDLSSQRFGNEPGILTLRAAGNLKLNASLSDGFNGTLPDSALLNATNRSWSYRLVAGADTSSANVLGLQSTADLAASQGPSGGNVNIGNDVLVRTGSGDIDVAAGRSVNFGNLGSVIYTSGASDGLELDKRVLNGTFPLLPTKYLPVNGGTLRIVAQGDIVGPGAPSGQTQLINEWLPQQKKITGNIFTPGDEAAGWWVNYAAFQQNIAAFGGGDVQIRAGGDITRLSASVPTTGYYDEQAKQTVTVGGGDLNVSAGGDIKSGLFFVGRGTGTLRAGGALTSGRSVANLGAPPVPLYTILVVMDGRFDVQTRGALTLQGVINPTLTPVLPNNVDAQTPLAIFPSYSPTSGVSLRSVAGDIVLVENPNSSSTIALSTLPRGTVTSESYTALAKAANIYPGTLEAVAFGGGIDVRNNLVLYPAPQGNLQLLAAGDVLTHGNLLVSDTDTNILPTLNTSVGAIDAVIGATSGSVSSLANAAKPYHAPIPVHTGDAEPIRIVSLMGDINGTNIDPGITSIWDFPKAAVIQAGHDIRHIRLHGQNLTNTDVTRVAAGRDIVQPSNADEIRLGGPGGLLLSAGRNIDLGQSAGVITTGNLYNPALTGSGADITVLAGSTVAPDYQAFDTHYLTLTGRDPQTGAVVDARAQTIGDAYRQVIVNYLRKLNNDPKLSQKAALAAYAALPEAQREPAILQGFYAELRAAGIEANQNKASNYVRGTDAIKILFPGDQYAGDLNLFFSQIYTLAGGDINLLVPGGLVNAGLATTPANAPNKTSSQLGIVAQGTGSVRAFARDDFLVNQSRVFTLLGGDILMWSTRGNIDAGRGAKTAISAPPPTFTTSADGKVTAHFSDAVTGSGIRAIVTRPGVAPGSVDLIAPEGEVNAGDAGIGAAGNLNIAAAQVRGADNIQVGGIATGVPAANSGGLAAGFAGAGDVAGSVSKSAEDAVKGLGKGAGTQDINGGMSFLDVEVIGYGTDDQGGNDVELRKRKPTDASTP